MIYHIEHSSNLSSSSLPHPIRLVQMTDMHLFSDPKQTLLGLNTDQSFQSVLDLIQQEQPSIDLLLSTGDIAQQADQATYQRFVALSAQIDAPHFCTQGNHDISSLFQSQVLNNQLPCEVVIGNWCCILLDSSQDQKIAGALSSSTLAYLSAALERQHDKFILIALHHNPVSIGSQWLDEHMLQNSPLFFDILRQHAHIKIVLHGHVHQEAAYQHQGIHCFACPATSLQFEPHNPQFSIDRKNPGYRWFDLYPNGSFDTHVSRTCQTTQSIEYDSTGY